MAANTNTSRQASFDAIVEIQLSSEGDQFQVLYSNQTTPTPPQPVRTAVSVSVKEVDGSAGVGPLHVVHLSLRPLEVQILRNTG